VSAAAQAGGDGFARTEDAGAHGADGAVHHVGNLFVAQAFDLAQRDGLPQIFGQRLDRGIHGSGDLLAGQQGLRRLTVA
jgi:hypothetical protein